MTARLITWILVALLAGAAPALAQQGPLVVSVWGGNWKDTVERVIGKAFTAKTGVPVEFEVGGTIDRLAKARVAKGSPLVDVNFTTTHVARLYISDGLLAPLDMAKLPNAKQIAREAVRSEYHLGSWAYVYTLAYRPDLVTEEITRWSDLWKPSLKGKIAMPDFDPSHIITIAALMEGGNELNVGEGPGAPAAAQAEHRRLLLHRRAEPGSDEDRPGAGAGHALRQRLSPPGAGDQRQGRPAPRLPGIVGIDTMAVMAGTKKSDLAHQFIDLALSKDIQSELVKACAPARSTPAPSCRRRSAASPASS